jgi:hypothetical protein
MLELLHEYALMLKSLLKIELLRDRLGVFELKVDHPLLKIDDAVFVGALEPFK